MGGGDLGAMGVVVHRRQGVQEAPDAGPQEGHDGGAQGPEDGGLVGVITPAPVDHVEGKDRHHEEGDRLHGGEDGTPPLPVFRRANPVIVMSRADDAGDQGHGDDDIEPLLHHLAVHARGLDEHEGQDGAQDEFPDTLDPQMHHPPPEELIQHQIGRVVEGEEEEDRQPRESDQQHQIDHGLAALEDGQADIEEEGEGDDDDAHLGDGGLLQELPAHGGQDVIARQLGQTGIGHQEIPHDGEGRGDQEDPEHENGQPG